jgi:septal ring factor EnvC (AmiA/AmiB activator)
MIRHAFLALLLLAGTGAAAEDPAEATRAAARAVDAAAARLAAAEGARNRLAAYGEAVQAHEAGLAALRAGARRVAARMGEIEAGIRERQEALAGLIGLLQGIERLPPPAQLLHPAGPLGAARAAMLMAELTPRLEQDLIALQAAATELAALAASQDAAAIVLRDGLASLQAARAALADALSRRRAPEGTDPAALARLGEGAATLRALADALSAVPGEAPAAPFAEARGRLPPPVAGRLLRGFGEADASGLARPGLIFEAVPLALVTAPWRATLRYAGPFLDYGEIAILEPEPGWLIVLAGLGRIDRTTGEVIEAGEPVGVLGGLQPEAEEFLIAGTAENRPAGAETLYVELRKDGEPVDPTPWFAVEPVKEGQP